MKIMVWERTLDGYHNCKPLYDYTCTINGVRFSIVKSTDAGFGLSVYDTVNQKYLTPRHGISWLRSLGRCKDAADKIAREHNLLED